MSESQIKLLAADGKVFEVDLKVALMFNPIKTFHQNFGLDDDPCDDPVPLPQVESAILEKIISWAIHHKDDPPVDPKEEDDQYNSTDIDEWDKKFMEIDVDIIFAMTRAANYLDVKGLLDLCCKTLANMIKGKSRVEILKLFNIRGY